MGLRLPKLLFYARRNMFFNVDRIASAPEIIQTSDAHRSPITHGVIAPSDHVHASPAPCNRGFHLSLERQVSP